MLSTIVTHMDIVQYCYPRKVTNKQNAFPRFNKTVKVYGVFLTDASSRRNYIRHARSMLFNYL
jgi:hypothetical protein